LPTLIGCPISVLFLSSITETVPSCDLATYTVCVFSSTAYTTLLPTRVTNQIKIDGKGVDYKEVANNVNARILSVDFSKDNRFIEIIGTQMTP
jgi:hypothetical protein